MSLRKILLRIMLWSLGIGAVLGAAAVLTSGGQTAWRITGTTFCTAFAAALLMATSRLADSKKGRLAGLFGMALVLAEFFLVIALIWDIPALFSLTSWNDSLAMTTLFAFVCGSGAMLFLRIGAEERGKVASIAGLILATATFVLLMIGTWLPGLWSARNLWLETGASIGLIGLLLVACLVDLGEGHTRRLMIPVRLVGAAAAALAMVMAVVGIWQHIHENEALFRAVISLAAVVTHANLCLLVPLTASQTWIRWATIAAAICTAVFLNMSLAIQGGDAEFTGRLGGAAGVIAACGSLALLVLASINRRLGGAPVLSEVREIVILCPGCRKKTTLPVGQGECPTCRLRFNIRVEEPHCANCNYLLFMLKSDRCPECGTSIDSAAGSEAPDHKTDPVAG